MERNEITYLYDTLVTSIFYFDSKCVLSCQEAFEKITIPTRFDRNCCEITILGKECQDGDKILSYFHDYQKREKKEKKHFMKTLTIWCCKKQFEKDKIFKVRWFFSKESQKLHIASGISEELGWSFLEFIFVSLIQNGESGKFKHVKTKCVLANGMAQARNGVVLYALARSIAQSLEENSHETSQIGEPRITSYVYTPDTHASLKIYVENPKCTVCVHSSGKILYMGGTSSKNIHRVNEFIAKIGKFWEPLPFF